MRRLTRRNGLSRAQVVSILGFALLLCVEDAHGGRGSSAPTRVVEKAEHAITAPVHSPIPILYFSNFFSFFLL